MRFFLKPDTICFLAAIVLLLLCCWDFLLIKWWPEKNYIQIFLASAVPAMNRYKIYIVRQMYVYVTSYVYLHLFFFSDFEVSRFYCDTRFWRSICHNPSAFASFCHLSPSWGSLYCVVSKVGSRRASKSKENGIRFSTS